MEKINDEIKKDEIKKDNIVNSMSNLGYTFLWNNLWDCWEIEISLNSFFEVQKYSSEAQAYKDKICSWIWKDIYIENEKWEVVEDKKTLSDIKKVFSVPTFKMLKEQYFTNSFCAGEVYLYPKTNLLWDITAQVVDNRTITKEVDKYWNILWYLQPKTWKKILNDKMYNSISRYNSSNPMYWQSLYESIVYDAFSEKESSKRQFYFFKNNAVPNSVFILDPEIATKDNIKQAQEMIDNKFKWSANSNKPLVSNAIKDVKILDVTNKDLDLINLREFFIKKMWIVFQIDPRLIGFISDVGAYNSIQAIREEARTTLNWYSTQLENDMNNFYKLFIDKKFKYKIKLESESFEDKEKKMESIRADFWMWAITLNEYRLLMNREVYKEEWADKPILESKYKIIPNTNDI